MKKSLLLASLLLLSILATAQIQKGFVKTLGRPEKKGEALSGVTIRVKGQHNPVISQADGAFSINMDDKKNGDPYSLQQVQKKGYEVNEAGLIGRQQTFSSKVPLTIVMASTMQLSADKERIEEQAQKVASKNYEEKIAQLEQQLADNKISAEQYQAAVADLLDKFEKYQQLIDGLAEHYAHTDYDLLNETEREINLCIENGDFNRADSLIKTLFDPIDVIKRNKEALASIDQQIAQAQSILDQAYEDMAAVLKQQEKDAEHLFQLYTIAAARFDNDKALFYIETRAELDTTRWEWQFEAGNYCFYQNLINKAEIYYERALDILDNLMFDFLDNNPDLANYNEDELFNSLSWLIMSHSIRTNLATLYQKTQRIAKSEEAYLESIEYFKHLVQFRPEDELATLPFIGHILATSMMGLSELYRSTNRYEECDALSQEALDILRKIKSDKSTEELIDPLLAKTLMSRGLMYKDKHQYKESEACLLEALAIHRRITQTDPSNEFSVAQTLHNLGNLYSDMKRYQESENALMESMEIYRRLAQANPQTYEIKVGMLASSIANMYEKTNHLKESEAMFLEAVVIKRRWAEIAPDAFEPELALTLANLSDFYTYYTKEPEKGEPLLLEAYEIYQRLAQRAPERYQPKLSSVKFQLARFYYETDKIKESLPLWAETLKEFEELSQIDPINYKSHYVNLTDFVKSLAPWALGEASDYSSEKQYEDAEYYFKNALEMFRLLAQSDPTTYEPEIATTLNDLGVMYSNTKRYEECEATYKETLEIKRRIAKNGNLEQKASLAITLNNLAYLYYVTKRYPESITYYAEALDITRKLVRQNPTQYQSYLSTELYYLSSAYSLMDDHQHSYETRKEYLPLQKANYESQPEKYKKTYASAMGGQAFQCLFIGRYEEAEQLARESFTIDDSQHWLNSNLAAALLFQGRFDEAKDVYLQYNDELKQSFLDDFKAFEDAGVIPEKRKADVERIKQLLNE